jgi:hypothetical protein
VDGKLVTDPKEMAEVLNTQFQSALSSRETFTAEQLSARCPAPPDEANRPHCDIITIDETGVRKLLKKLYPNKASGPDGISPRILKELAPELAPSLTLFYQASLQSGIVPPGLKVCFRHSSLQEG